jgi:hypothetical protein
MDIERLIPVLALAGISGLGMSDALARSQSRFGDTDPDAAQLDAWSAQLQQEAPHLFLPTAPPSGVTFSAEEKLARQRPVGPNKFKAPVITDKAALAELDAIKTPTAKLTAYRELIAQQGEHRG